MPLTLRLALTYLLLTLAGLLLLGGGLLVLAERELTARQTTELAAQAEIYASYLAALATTPVELQGLAGALSPAAVLPAGVDARLFSPTGALLSGSSGLGPFPSRPVLALTRNDLPQLASAVEDRLYVAQLIGSTQDPIGIVELSQSTSETQLFLARLRRLTFQTALLAGLVMMAISAVVAVSIARPIVRLTRRAQGLATGAARPAPLPDQPAAVRGDEIAMLGYSLDDLARQLQARISEVEGERARLAAVLASISEGVIAVDYDGAVLLANPAARRLLAAESAVELARRLGELELPHTTPVTIEREVEWQSRRLLATLNPVAAPEQLAATPGELPLPRMVVVLRDITRLRELEQARTRFLRNISHDLRTPLTTLRGMLENLRDDAPPAQQTALATMETEAARLTRLVDELLHPPADGALLLTERRLVHPGVLARELTALQQGRARRAGIALSCSVADGVAPVYGDRDRLKQALLNLLDNALRVTPPGGTVSVQVQPVPETGGMVQIIVADSGPGVPDTLRERIWERGARGVDLGLEDQALDYGGVGLGLAIVREIVTAHGGQAHVEPNEPTGARFVIELPGEAATV